MGLRTGPHQGNSKMDTLEKRVPRNPRYADVQSKVDTGMTVDKLTFITTRQHLRRQEEPYHRLSPSQLSDLLTEYEQDVQEGVQDFRHHIDPDHHGPRVVEHDADAAPSYERPYLILDVRSPDEFRRCHITQARCFEGKLLNQDHMTPELFRFKNKEGGLVVLYCNEDREACIAATTLVHRGFDNVFVLSTGIVGLARGSAQYIEGDTSALPQVLGPSTRGVSLRRRCSGTSSTGDGGDSILGESSGGSVKSSAFSTSTSSRRPKNAWEASATRTRLSDVRKLRVNAPGAGAASGLSNSSKKTCNAAAPASGDQSVRGSLGTRADSNARVHGSRASQAESSAISSRDPRSGRLSGSLRGSSSEQWRGGLAESIIAASTQNRGRGR